VRWVHFSDKPLPATLDSFVQTEHVWIKPRGLWISDEDAELGWLAWCRDEGGADFMKRCKFVHNVTLKPNAEVLHLKSCSDIDWFTKEFHFLEEELPTFGGTVMMLYINWMRVSKVYQGIIITPYQWDCRFDFNCNWYYGWDCASGCIWDAGAVEAVERVADVSKRKIRNGAR
jgi:hypothetical protein